MTLLWILTAAAGLARAEVTINAEVNKSEVALDDQIVLSVTVSGDAASVPEPRMPPMPNFSVYSSGRSQNISFVNGRVSSSIVYTYVLVPHFVGKGTIPAIPVAVGGTQVQTSPIEIQVIKPGSATANPAQAQAPPSRAPTAAPTGPGAAQVVIKGASVFVTAELDKRKAYVNEQATLSVKFYTAVNLLGNPQYNAPKISGFLAEDLPPERHGEVNLHGRTYYFSEIKTALFPAQAGSLAIGPATVRCQVQQDVSVDPFSADFFEKFFSQGLAVPQTRDLASEPLTLSAQPLPENGKPKGFSGAVGDFSISAAVDRARTKVGEAVNLTLTVAGTGNLKAIGDPQMPALDAFRAYDTVSSLNMDKKDDRVRGSKVFKTVLVPRVSGDLSIPPIAFSFFDPQKGGYQTASSLPISVKVDAAAPGSAPSANYLTASAPAQGLSAVSEDIRYLKTVRAKSAVTALLERIAGSGLWNGLPFLLFAMSLLLAQYRELGAADPLGARARRALKQALGRVKEAGRAGDPHRAAGLMAEALTNYLADKLGQPAAGLSLRRVEELLTVRQPQLSEASLDRIRSLWEELDLRRFSPEAGKAAGHEKVAEALKELLSALEKEMGG